VALGSGGRGFNGTGNIDLPSGDEDFDFDGDQWDLPKLRGRLGLGEVAIITIILVLASLALVVGIVFWVVSTIARGGLIAGASTIDGGGASTFAAAWNSGWERGWRLLGIGILPAIPGFFLIIAALGALGVFAGVYGLFGELALLPSGAGLGVLFAALVCILVPITLVLNLLRTFANRACMLEDLGVIAAYRRGLNVLVENIGPAVILFVLQVVINVVLGVALFLPGLVMVLCCILWPLLLAIEGMKTSYFSTLWTLAWRDWTGLGHAGVVRPEAPAASGV
jgi:hypothetical protein